MPCLLHHLFHIHPPQLPAVSPPFNLYTPFSPKLSQPKWPTKAITLSKPVTCMANPRRVKMVAKQIRRELSDMLLTDKVLQYAVLPEASLGADRYLSSLTTISDVEVSGDLQDWSSEKKIGSAKLIDGLYYFDDDLPSNKKAQGLNSVVKVYVSVFGDERGREVALAGLKAKAKYVRGELGKRMKLRLTPEIRFIEDESQERGSRVIAILDRIKNEKDIPQGSDYKEQSDPSNLSPKDRDWDEEDPDDGIIYVE